MMKGYRIGRIFIRECQTEHTAITIDSFPLAKTRHTSWPPFHPSIAFYNLFDFFFRELGVLVSAQMLAIFGVKNHKGANELETGLPDEQSPIQTEIIILEKLFLHEWIQR